VRTFDSYRDDGMKSTLYVRITEVGFNSTLFIRAIIEHGQLNQIDHDAIFMSHIIESPVDDISR